MGEGADEEVKCPGWVLLSAERSHLAGQRSQLRNLGALWLAFMLPLAYLEVPVVNLPFFATALVLNAALGTALLTNVFSGLPSSLLLICGPGLIVGGAVSYVAFEIVGRGVLGSFVVILSGATAVVLLNRSVSSAPTDLAVRMRTLCNMVGLAFLALSSEMSWLIFTACGFFVISAVLESRLSQKTLPLALGWMALVLTSALAISFRSETWWLITDDYLFFETLINHLSRSGPFELWGASDFSRYHWLSYGWSGLLSHLALTPDTLVTLTRVMPIVYGLAFGASVLFCIHQLNPHSPYGFVRTSLPAWSLLGVFRLDWSGTSTVASIVVIAALSGLLLFIVNTEQALSRRLMLYSVFGLIVLFSKAPGVLVLPLLVSSTEVLLLLRQRGVTRRAATLIGVSALACILTLALLPTFSSVVGGFTIEWGEKRGDALSRSGLVPTLVTLTGRNAWIIALIVVAWMLRRRSSVQALPASQLLVLSLFPALGLAIVMDALVVGVGNTNEYFSRPLQFLSLLSLLVIGTEATRSDSMSVRSKQRGFWVLTALSAIALASVFNQLDIQVRFASSVLKNFLSDQRVLFCIVLLGVLATKHKRIVHSVHHPVSVLLVLVAAVGVSPTVERLINDGVQPITSDIEMNTLVGPPDARTVALWLRDNSVPSDLVATNYLRDKSGEFDNDYSLAAWSRREFLALGPSLSFDSASTGEAIRISEEFGVRPSVELAARLRAQGVKWYIVDLDKTPLRSWDPYAETVVMTWRFWVLRL